MLQAGYAILFYVSVVSLFRIAGKRLAGQITTFDLMVLIGLIVALEGAFLLEGRSNKFIFVVTGFAVHLLVTKLCSRSRAIRYFVRGMPARLIRDGVLIYPALRGEGLSVDELNAGIRKAGIDKIENVKEAYLEETGDISAIPVSEVVQSK